MSHLTDIVVSGYHAAVTALLSVGKSCDFTLVERDIEVGGPFEFALTAYKVYGIDRKFKTAVVDTSDILLYGRETERTGHFGVEQQVFGVFVVDIDFTVDAVVEETEVQTDISLVGSFPFQVSVTYLTVVDG